MSRKRFTLVELLVVIAIIAILSSLLLPGLKIAREKSRMAVCKSNIKQINYALVMYQDDNNAKYPYSIDHNNNATLGQRSWDDLLSSYDGRNISDGNALKNAVLLKSLGYNSDVYSCPSDTLQRTHWIGNNKIMPASYVLTVRYFGAAWSLTDWARGVTSKNPERTQKSTNLSSPSTTLTLVELSHEKRIVGHGQHSFRTAGDYANSQTPHEDYGKDNYLMADGSVRTMNFWATLAMDSGGSGTPGQVQETMWDSAK
ncbi:hypothetical protein LNTAR_22154 [Lentisphaera araneosa HTCC2155]|uniref:DUF1559 domain-containing protein n=1 Tax=Lentisphaera araneosa HTCC2155 TaxID=313628 RepID=A6DG22_9BACT|nr:type II secretion system protein [Lentisphaera araneosa]EDM29139.1 hypothetical protein LNTAR_22154 [Lentisphaera araneosa HTCC2155]